MSKKSLSSSQLLDFKKTNKSLKKELEKCRERIVQLKMDQCQSLYEIKKLKKELKISEDKAQSYKDEVDMLYGVISELENN